MERSRDHHGIQMLRLTAFHLQHTNHNRCLAIPNIISRLGKQVHKNWTVSNEDCNNDFIDGSP